MKHTHEIHATVRAYCGIAPDFGTIIVPKSGANAVSVKCFRYIKKSHAHKKKPTNEFCSENLNTLRGISQISSSDHGAERP